MIYGVNVLHMNTYKEYIVCKYAKKKKKIQVALVWKSFSISI